ncbi:aminofutalosine deaminase family hydrolase [Campylobacter sp. MG1]|uniref:aminofutalosine deaminase family hydrolase n=1 Tax=Campylobacter sp. MG1 TaxID=2976332 RepID=UPI00226C7AD6|nr:aminofutalosine deaminase family hydrolase [Campylobacter sp. MG1]
MINIIKVKAILDFSKKDYILYNKVIVFDDKIIGIMDFDEAIKIYKNANILDYGNYILSPVFCNIHSHLEFCTSRLDYGNFTLWLESIIKNRENINKEILEKEIDKNINIMLHSGVGYLGEISSFGGELEILSKSKIKSIIFHEILGANKSVAQKNIDFFCDRFNRYSNLKNNISLHSPYSICDEVYDFAINYAKNNDLLISTHFMESIDEKNYLNGKKNKFSNYLKSFNPSRLTRNFLRDFYDLKAIFTHCNYVDDFSIFNNNHIITTCARSNRYLGSKKINLKNVLKNNIKLSLGTDGLSSNDSLNFFDELRANIILHNEFDLEKIAYILFKTATYDNAHLFLNGFNPLEYGACADFMLLDDFGYDKSQILIQTILRNKEVKQMFLDGKEIL